MCVWAAKAEALLPNMQHASSKPVAASPGLALIILFVACADHACFIYILQTVSANILAQTKSVCRNWRGFSPGMVYKLLPVCTLLSRAASGYRGSRHDALQRRVFLLSSASLIVCSPAGWLGRHHPVSKNVPPLSDSPGGGDGPIKEGGGSRGHWGPRADCC